MNKEEIDLDELLSGGVLSGAQYDEIGARVFQRDLDGARPRMRLAPVLSVAALAAAVGGLFLISNRQLDQASGLRSKGAADSVGAAAMVELGCAGLVSEAGKLHCPLGSTLMFSVRASSTPRHLAAFAESQGQTNPEPIWYFPASEGSLATIPASESTVVLDQGVALGAPHQPGRYRVTVRLLDEPATRDALRSMPEEAAVFFDLIIEP